MITLCTHCNNSNGNGFQQGTCHICGGGLTRLDEMVSEAKTQLEQEDCKSFSLSTAVPKDWMINEERVWDEKVDKSRSIKDYLNGSIAKEISDSCRITYDPDGDCRVVFDLKSGRIMLERNDVFVFGRYEKLRNGISQSRWICKQCQGKGCKRCEGKGKNYESIEEYIGGPAKALFDAGDYSLHASGREDVDAFNSAGRPFILSLKNPKKRSVDLKELEKSINQGGMILVRDMKMTHRGAVELVSESHFDKEYIAEVEFERELSPDTISKINSFSGTMLSQETPKRVVHRRADLTRKRKILNIGVLENSGNIATLRIRAEAGTYIKELINGDDGRTVPSISAIMGMKAECKKLTVSKIEDGFLDIVKF